MIVETSRINETYWDVTELLSSAGLRYRIEGDAKKRIVNVASLGEATSSDLAFCSSEGNEASNAIAQSNAGVILCSTQLAGLLQPRKGTQVILLDNPRRSFVMLANEMQKRLRKDNASDHALIADTAIISASARIGNNCEIGNFVVIGDNCVIGSNTKIHDRVTIRPNCKLGENCIIQSGVTIGEDGFSFERYDSTELEKFPHFKGVIIGDSVEICANSNVARGSLSDTVIGTGTKIDAMVHIAHNVRVGSHCQLTGGTVIGGSAIISDYCWTGLNCTIKDHARLGSNVIVAAGACVIHDVPDGDVVAGIPAKSIKHKVSDPNLFLMAGQKGPVTK